MFIGLDTTSGTVVTGIDEAGAFVTLMSSDVEGERDEGEDMADDRGS